jgi:hypothetical protein
MFVALTEEVEQWLRLRPREVPPKVIAQTRPGHVAWSSLWPASPGDQIDFHIRTDGAGSAVRFVWSSPTPPDERGVGLVRHHLNQAFADDLRYWVDQQVRRDG